MMSRMDLLHFEFEFSLLEQELIEFEMFVNEFFLFSHDQVLEPTKIKDVHIGDYFIVIITIANRRSVFSKAIFNVWTCFFC